MLRLTSAGGRLTAAELRQAAKTMAEKGLDFAYLTTDQGILLEGPEAPFQGPACPLANVDSAEYFDSGVRQQEQSDLFTLALPVPAGRIDADQLRKVADVAERYADGTVRLTPRQNILLSNVPKERVAQILESLEAVGLSARASFMARAVVLCPSGEAELGRRAREMAEYLEKRVPLDQPFTVHMSGLEGCPHHAGAEIGLQVQHPGAFTVWVKGRPAAREVPADQLRFRLEQLLVGYKKDRAAGEELGAFFDRVGEEAVNRLLSEESPETTAAG